MGWPIEGYLNREHPLQRQNLSTMETFAGIPAAHGSARLRAAESIATGVDGCGVPTYYLSLRALAVAYAQLANPLNLPSDMVVAAQRVARAMCEHPFLVAGSGRFTVDLTRQSGGRILLKTGAEGLIAAAIPELGLGLAIKIADGSSRAHPVVVCRILAELLPDLDWTAILKSVNPPIENTRGEVVGEVAAAF
jgi:L-asparaginase II